MVVTLLSQRIQNAWYIVMGYRFNNIYFRTYTVTAKLFFFGWEQWINHEYITIQKTNTNTKNLNIYCKENGRYEREYLYYSYHKWPRRN